MTTKPFTDLPFFARPSALGILFGALAFTAALTPSLIPRTGPLQGAVAGAAFALVYALAVAVMLLWRWLGLPLPRSPWPGRVALAAAAAVIAWGLSQATGWQNQIHAVMGMEPVETARPVIIAATSLVVVLVLMAIGRLFRRAAVILANWAARFVPVRVAMVLGIAFASVLFWSIGSGVLMDRALSAMDNTYRRIDALIPADVAPPTDPLKSGSPESLVGWQGLGAQGRNRVVAFPDAATIEQVTGQPALEPLRVYVGLNNAEEADERADLALAELIRIGGFDRKLLVIATPTGTGWIDPASMTPLEFLWGGDIASVSVQYSYLPSWLSLIVQPEYGEETARAVFRRVYDHWRKLPKDSRPRLYLHGLSLGSLNSDLSLDIFDIVGDPPQGAFWVGPPFASRLWPQITAARNAGTPAWSPEFRDGSFVRFTTQTDTTEVATAPWGDTRILYLQYPSDAIVFFEPDSFYRAPEWMAKPRGPDVSPGLNWIPVVTFLQLLTDMMTATLTPTGHGHVYAARHYMEGWVAVTSPPRADAATLEKLRAWFAEQGI
jgi:uncharacterized membrane protein